MKTIGSEIFVYLLRAELQKTLVKFKGLETMLFKNRAYTKHQDIHDQKFFRKSGLLYFACIPESNPILRGHGLRY